MSETASTCDGVGEKSSVQREARLDERLWGEKALYRLLSFTSKSCWGRLGWVGWGTTIGSFNSIGEVVGKGSGSFGGAPAALKSQTAFRLSVSCTVLWWH